MQKSNASPWFKWLLIILAALIVVGGILAWVFPELIRQFVALMVGALVAVTGLFLRKK